MQTHAGRLGFDLWAQCQCMPRSCHALYVSTDFGADSWSHFAFTAQTKRQTNWQTWLNDLHHAGGYAAGMGNKT